jgi:Flp pilus assembly protein TadG
MKTVSKMWRRARRSGVRMLTDCSGIAATEFAVIVPIMLVLFFGTVEFSTGVAIDRKVTLVARTLSDLTSQTPPPTPQSNSATVTDVSLQNIFTASIAILSPYEAAPTKATISEIYIDSSKNAKIQWSKAATITSGASQATLTTSSHNPGDAVTASVPPTLLVAKTYVILSEVSYLYTPSVGYVMAPSGVTLTDVSYTRPRQVACVIYNGLPAANPTPCPTP